MTRPVRIEYENAYYHVMNLGQGRKCLFHDASYFKAFLQTLSKADERFGLQGVLDINQRVKSKGQPA